MIVVLVVVVLFSPPLSPLLCGQIVGVIQTSTEQVVDLMQVVNGKDSCRLPSGIATIQEVDVLVGEEGVDRFVGHQAHIEFISVGIATRRFPEPLHVSFNDNLIDSFTKQLVR